MATKNWPDGTPGMPSDIPTGGTGGIKDGRALRHADGTEPPAENMGWLDKTAAAKSDPQGTGYTPIGPGSKAWNTPAPAGPFTTGMQRAGRKKGRH